MSIRELIEINKIVFGAEKPVIRAFFSGKVRGLESYFINSSLLQNQFIFTGAESSRIIVECDGGDLYCLYFANYLCLWDLSEWLYNSCSRLIKEVINIHVEINRVVSHIDIKGTTTENGIAQIGMSLRWYLVEYNQTKKMLL